MKKCLNPMFVMAFLTYSLNSQVVHIPDTNFLNALIEFGYDHNQDGLIQADEVAYVDFLDVSNHNIYDLTGIRSLSMLQYLDASSNMLDSVDLSGLDSLSRVQIEFNDITWINLQGLSNLGRLDIEGNALTNLDVTPFKKMYSLNCTLNSIDTLLAGNMPKLKGLFCEENSMKHLDIAGSTKLLSLYVKMNRLTKLNLSGMADLLYVELQRNMFTDLNFGDCASLVFLDCRFNKLNSLNLDASDQLEKLHCNNNELTTLEVGSHALKELICSNNSITGLVLPKPDSLYLLDISSNEINEIDLSGYSALSVLNVSTNKLTQLDVSDQLFVQEFQCSSNQLQVLEIAHLGQLDYFKCHHNQLSSLVFPIGIDWRLIDISNNLLDTISFAGISSVQIGIYCDSNQFSSLDVSPISTTLFLYCRSNDLQTLNLKNGAFTRVYLENNPNLEFICVDEDEAEKYFLEMELANHQYEDIVYNSYCTHVPGGEYFEVNGVVSFCGLDTFDVSFAKLTVTAADDTFCIYTDENGRFDIPIQAGDYEFKVNNDYSFVYVVPESVVLVFPRDTGIAEVDFCYTPSTIYNDLEISILPLDGPRPGFEVDYKVVFRNLATKTLSGDIKLQFDNNVMTFLASNPSATSISDGTINWEYENLLPFESREILLSFLLNSPMDIPPLNGGDTMKFLSTIFPLIGDDDPSNNEFSFNHITVNSFDPNDKICLEGRQMHVDNVGEYLHYMIRFENTGNANANNVVIKDVLDERRFDISTLRPLSGSHQFFTRIRDNNVVEFVFENIDLPYVEGEKYWLCCIQIKTPAKSFP